MAWLFLLIAAAFEIAFATSMKAAEGFTRLGWTVATAVAVTGAIGFLTLALREIPLSVGYTVWTGLGIVGTVFFGLVAFGESFSAVKLFGVAAIVTGVLILRFAVPDST